MICARCKVEFDQVIEPRAREYNVCDNCWNEWRKYSIMVINDLRLDMSIKEHRGLLKRYERVYFGVEKAEGVKDLTKEDERTPDKV